LGKYSKFASAGDKANVRTAVDALSREHTADTDPSHDEAADQSTDHLADAAAAAAAAKDAPF
jgi:myo-inositol-1(or 4)-monophosphatase